VHKMTSCTGNGVRGTVVGQIRVSGLTRSGFVLRTVLLSTLSSTFLQPLHFLSRVAFTMYLSFRLS